MSKKDHDSAIAIERRKTNLAKRERRDRIWNIAIIVIAAVILLTIFAIQISHHL